MSQSLHDASPQLDRAARIVYMNFFFIFADVNVGVGDEGGGLVDYVHAEEECARLGIVAVVHAAETSGSEAFVFCGGEYV